MFKPTSVLVCQLVLALLHTSLKALYRRSCGPVKPSYDLQFIRGEWVGHEHLVHGVGEGSSRKPDRFPLKFIALLKTDVMFVTKTVHRSIDGVVDGEGV